MTTSYNIIKLLISGVLGFVASIFTFILLAASGGVGGNGKLIAQGLPTLVGVCVGAIYYFVVVTPAEKAEHQIPLD